MRAMLHRSDMCERRKGKCAQQQTATAAAVQTDAALLCVCVRALTHSADTVCVDGLAARRYKRYGLHTAVLGPLSLTALRSGLLTFSEAYAVTALQWRAGIEDGGGGGGCP